MPPVSSVRRRVLTVLQRYRHLGWVAVVTHGTVIHTLTGRDVAGGQAAEFELA